MNKQKSKKPQKIEDPSQLPSREDVEAEEELQEEFQRHEESLDNTIDLEESPEALESPMPEEEFDFMSEEDPLSDPEAEEALEMLRQQDKQDLLKREEDDLLDLEYVPPPEAESPLEKFSGLSIVREVKKEKTQPEVEYYEELNRSTPINLDEWFENNQTTTGKDLNKNRDLPLEILTLCYSYTPKTLTYWAFHDAYNSIPVGERHARLANFLMEYVDFKCVTDTYELLYYNSKEGIWMDKGEDIIKEFCYVFNDPMKRHITAEALERIKVLNPIKRKYLDKKYLLSVHNGVININDFTFHEHDREHMITHKMPVVYDAIAYPERITKFMSEIVKEEDIELLKEIIGYTLYPDYIYHKYFVMLGSGANGKSTLLNVITQFLGQENVSNVFLNDLADSPYHTATLFGKMANIVADLPSIPIKNTSMLKALTGNDWVQVMKKYEHPFTFQNKAKIIYSCNYLPKIIYDDSYALWRRIVLIVFPYKFEGENRDERLLDKLTTPEELSGLLNMALMALWKLRIRGYFEKDDETNIEKTKSRYLAKSDTTRSFISTVLHLEQGLLELKSDVDRAYHGWCVTAKDSNVITDSQNVFTRRMKELVEGASIVQRTVDGVQRRYWKGFKVREEWSFLATEYADR